MRGTTHLSAFARFIQVEKCIRRVGYLIWLSRPKFIKESRQPLLFAQKLRARGPVIFAVEAQRNVFRSPLVCWLQGTIPVIFVRQRRYRRPPSLSSSGPEVRIVAIGGNTLRARVNA